MKKLPSALKEFRLNGSLPHGEGNLFLGETYEWAIREVLGHEGFDPVIPAPKFRGIPFKFLAFRGVQPFMIGLSVTKGTLLQAPSVTLKLKLDVLKTHFASAHYAFLQGSIREENLLLYRLVYNGDIKPKGHIPSSFHWGDDQAAPVITWMRLHIAHEADRRGPP